MRRRIFEELGIALRKPKEHEYGLKEPSVKAQEGSRELRDVPVSLLIIRDAIQPSREFIEDIKSRGILVELRVREEEGRYVVDAGRRRALAARLAGLETVPCIISPGMSAEDNLAENNLRKANPVTDLLYLKELMIKEGLSEKEIAKRTGMTVATQRKRLKLDRLIEPLRKAITELTESGKVRLTVSLAERIASHLTTDEQRELAGTLAEKGILTVKDYRSLRLTHAQAVTFELFRDLNMEL
jgi:ParB family chromosome partitioning protein